MRDQKNYKNTGVIASNGYVGILDIIDDYVLTTLNKRYSKIKYTAAGEPYFIKYGVKYFLNEFFRTNFNTL